MTRMLRKAGAKMQNYPVTPPRPNHSTQKPAQHTYARVRQHLQPMPHPPGPPALSRRPWRGVRRLVFEWSLTTDSYRFAADRAQARETPAGERWRHGHRGCGRDRGGADHHLHGRLCVPRLVLPSQRLDDRPRTMHCREVQALVRARVDYVAPGVNRPASQQCRTAQPLGFHRGWVRCDTQWGGFGDPLLRRVCVAFSSSGP